jgi:hypothetical protein
MICMSRSNHAFISFCVSVARSNHISVTTKRICLQSAGSSQNQSAVVVVFRSGFSDQSESFPFAHEETDAIYGAHMRPLCGKIRAESGSAS